MIGDQGFSLTEADDGFHVPTTDDPLWSETTWFSFMVPERKLYVYVYPWVRANQMIFGGGVMAWDDRGHNPWDCVLWDYEWNRPIDELGDLRSYRSPTGIGIEVLEPLRRYHITYDRPHCQIDVTYEALMEPHVLGHGEPAGLFSAHFDQPGHVTGSITIRGEQMDVDCYSIRDRSWGPRTENPDFRLGYTCAQTADRAFLAITYPDRPGDQVQWGYHWRDGEAAALVSGTRSVARDGRWPARVTIEGTDALGRDVRAVGECVNRVSYTNVPYMFVWVSLVRWRLDDGAEAWGEDQDAWHVEKYRAFARSLGPDGKGG